MAFSCLNQQIFHHAWEDQARARRRKSTSGNSPTPIMPRDIGSGVMVAAAFTEAEPFTSLITCPVAKLPSVNVAPSEKLPVSAGDNALKPELEVAYMILVPVD